MYAPHTVTLINVVEGNDYAMSYHKTLLTGVFLDVNKANNVQRSGLSDADVATLFIPFDVTATQGMIEAKFISPKAYDGLDQKDGYWTLKSGGSSSATDCFFVKGDVDAMSYNEALQVYDYVYRVTSVDLRDFGSDFCQHWQVGGR